MKPLKVHLHAANRESLMLHRLGSFFNFGAFLILAGVGVIKIVSGTGDAAYLRVPDAVLSFLTTRQLVLGAGALEVGVGILALSKLGLPVRLGALAWLSSIFVLYRVGAWWVGAPPGCPCLGTVGDGLPISMEGRKLLADLFLAYLSIGSFGLLGAYCYKGPKSGPSSEETILTDKQIQIS